MLVHGLPSFRPPLGHCFNGIDDRVIAGAAAVVSRQMLADLVPTRHFFCSLQKVLGRSQHAGGAEATLQRIALLKCSLQVSNLA